MKKKFKLNHFSFIFKNSKFRMLHYHSWISIGRFVTSKAAASQGANLFRKLKHTCSSSSTLFVLYKAWVQYK